MIPKSILNHEAVEKASYAPSLGFDEYKYNVFLKNGWVFESGRNSGGREYNFNTVADFKYANPVRTER